MNRYAALRKSLGRPLFIPFAVLGDPDQQTSFRVIEELIRCGADALELGIPFSDPTADGPTIQAADKRAIASGVTAERCFAIMRNIRKLHDLPIGILTYFNIIFSFGAEKFFEACKSVRLDSVLIADLPLEHVAEISEAAKSAGIALVSIVSERTTDERIKEIVKSADGYLYLVSYLGVTGKEDRLNLKSMASLVRRCRKQTDLPLFVGFGISTPEDVSLVVESGADGAIVGSRIVRDVPDIRKIASVCSSLRTGLVAVQ